MPDEIGRVTFPNNPWPQGHAIKEFEWSARFIETSGVWMDFHLESTDYYADDPPGQVDSSAPDDMDDWTSRILWYNYHSCILSSTHWAEEETMSGGSPGVLVGTEQSPLDLSLALCLTSDQDLSDPQAWPRPFGLYLLGHDAAADHRISISPNAGRKSHSIEWTGRIALVYGGSNSFDHSFRAVIHAAPFLGIRLESGSVDAARRCLEHPEMFEAVERNGVSWLIPRAPSA